MKYLLLLTLTLLSWSLQAQIMIDRNDMPAENDTFRYSLAPNNYIVDVNQTGPNYIWDFNDLTFVEQDVYDYKSSFNTQYAFFFFNTYGLKIAETLGAGNFEFNDVYQFFRNRNTSYSAIGVGMTYQNVPIPSYYSDRDELYQFPLEYGDQDTSTYRITFDLQNGTSFTQSGTRINTVDGWGSISTPYIQNEACIRVKVETFQIDSVTFNGFSFGFDSYDINYEWLAKGIKIPLLDIEGTENNGNYRIQSIRYRDSLRIEAPTSTNQLADKEKAIYPNPFQNYIQVDLNKTYKNVSVHLLNTLGQEVVNLNLSDKNRIRFETEKLSLGHYLLFIQLDNDYLIQKMLKE